MDNNLNEFLKELTKLSRKYNIGIGGCGCCGSPFLYNIKTEKIISEDLELGKQGYGYNPIKNEE